MPHQASASTASAPARGAIGMLVQVRRALSAVDGRVDAWLAAFAGTALVLLAIVNVTLAQGLGNRCDTCYLAGTEFALATFRQRGPPMDFAQEVLGARRLLEGRNAYPILEEALPEVGMQGMRAPHASTHPPTAFLFGIPFVGLPWPQAARHWGLWMLAVTIVSWRATGLGWPAALALTAWGLAWPPLALSLGQLTPIWLLGQVLGWHWRHTPWLAGAALGVASLTKFLPALLLIPFILRGRWAALVGFGVMWIMAAGLLLWLAPGVFTDYLRVAVPTATDQAARWDNGAFFPVATHRIGPPAPLLAGLMVTALAVRAVRTTLSAPDLERHTWALWAWLSVVLLPIAWQVSLLPLATELIIVAKSGRFLPRLLAGAAVASSMLLPWDGHLGRNGEGVFLFLVLTGMALAMHHAARSQQIAYPSIGAVRGPSGAG